jgi:hypothetical protein
MRISKYEKNYNVEIINYKKNSGFEQEIVLVFCDFEFFSFEFRISIFEINVFIFAIHDQVRNC